MNDRIRVRIDPEKKVTAGGVVIPESATEGVLATGVVLDVGPGLWSKKGNKRCPVGVEKGEGVVFVKFHHLTETNKGVQHVIGKDELLLQPNDILLAYDRKNPPEIV
jgi:co-chaperonin GroES (HSP10)